ncbi:hypothetical protein BV20DRAFT_902627, partial [Pilatotrama ljubarskyi]
LTYVEWFTPFTQPNRNHGMYKISRSLNRHSTHLATVVEVSKIRHICHLFPQFEPIVLRDWTCADV